ncbi:MAG: hypothetical protein ACE5HA_13125 [Anaerolineae bacterium]
MPRVYLIFRNQLFSDAIHAILRAHANIDLVGATTEPDQVVADVVALTPDVILLEETEGSPAMTGIHALLSSPIPYRLITLRLDEDGMHVWSQIWRRTVQAEDLVQAIVTADTTGANEHKNYVEEAPAVVSSK